MASTALSATPPATPPTQQSPSPPLIELFKGIESKFPAATLGNDKWYFVAIAALTGLGKTNSVAELYLYLIQKPQYTSPEARKELMKRLREALVKCVSIVGICKPLEAVFCIDAVTREEDRDYSFSR